MELVIENVGNVAVVTIAVEELDASNTRELNRDIAPALAAGTRMVIDLSRMRFIDSSGLGSFLSCFRKLSAGGGGLKLCGMSKQVRAAFELVRMHHVLDIYETRDEAVSAFRAG